MDIKYHLRKIKRLRNKVKRYVYIFGCRIVGIHVFGLENTSVVTLINGRRVQKEVETRVYKDRIEIDKFKDVDPIENNRYIDFCLTNKLIFDKTYTLQIGTVTSYLSAEFSDKDQVFNYQGIFREIFIDGDHEKITFDRINIKNDQ